MKLFLSTPLPIRRLILASLLIGILIVWQKVVIPEYIKINSDFSYHAEVIALDNFYNEETQSFVGENRSVASLSYDVVKNEKDKLIIKNSFNARKISGETIVSINRLYAINPFTGAHIPGSGDERRTGFLFAPRHLKKGQPFTYWHANYNQPAHMRFVSEENIFGLTVYHYETRFEGQKIDQTDNLHFLPGVPNERGVLLEPHLEIWVEPVTGHLIKYTDDTLASYYSQKTGAKLFPWNHFKNSITRATTIQQVHRAQHEKIVSLIIEYVIPAILSLALVLLGTIFIPSFFGWAVAFIIFLTTAYTFFSTSISSIQEKKTIVGISTWNTTSEYEQTVQGFKDVLSAKQYVEGKNIEYLETSSDLDEKKQLDTITLFKEKKLDLIFSLTGPGTLAAKAEISDRPIVFSFVAFPVELGLISSLTSSNNNLVGTRNWISAENQLSLVKKLVPLSKKIGFVHRSGSFFNKEIIAAAPEYGLEIVDIAANDLPNLIGTINNNINNLDALYGSCDLLMQNGGDHVMIDLANKHNKPSFSCFEFGIKDGALAGIVPDYYELGRLSGEKAALILDGVAPTALETSAINRPFIFFNQSTADRLGIAIPQSLLLHAHHIFP